MYPQFYAVSHVFTRSTRYSREARDIRVRQESLVMYPQFFAVSHVFTPSLLPHANIQKRIHHELSVLTSIPRVS